MEVLTSDVTFFLFGNLKIITRFVFLESTVQRVPKFRTICSLNIFTNLRVPNKPFAVFRVFQNSKSSETSFQRTEHSFSFWNTQNTFSKWFWNTQIATTIDLRYWNTQNSNVLPQNSIDLRFWNTQNTFWKWFWNTHIL